MFARRKWAWRIWNNGPRVIWSRTRSPRFFLWWTNCQETQWGKLTRKNWLQCTLARNEEKMHSDKCEFDLRRCGNMEENAKKSDVCDTPATLTQVQDMNNVEIATFYFDVNQWWCALVSVIIISILLTGWHTFLVMLLLYIYPGIVSSA